MLAAAAMPATPASAMLGADFVPLLERDGCCPAVGGRDSPGSDAPTEALPRRALSSFGPGRDTAPSAVLPAPTTPVRAPTAAAPSPPAPSVSPAAPPAVAALPTPAAPAPSAGTASGAVDPVGTIISDMKLFHDGPVAVLEALRDWGSGADWPEATPRPSGWQYAIPWTHVITDTSHPNGNGYPWRVPGPYTGNQAPNTRVQQRDLKMWWLLADGRWVLGARNDAMEPILYPYDWSEGTETRGGDVWRREANNGGGVSMRAIGREQYARHLWHTWAGAHRIPDGAVGAVTVFFMRKILDNPNGPDDRNSARILAGGAGDWYRDTATLSSFKTQGVNVLYMGFSRMKYITNDWQLFGWTSLTEAQLRANPPPITGLR